MLALRCMLRETQEEAMPSSPQVWGHTSNSRTGSFSHHCLPLAPNVLVSLQPKKWRMKLAPIWILTPPLRGWVIWADDLTAEPWFSHPWNGVVIAPLLGLAYHWPVIDWCVCHCHHYDGSWSPNCLQWIAPLIFPNGISKMLRPFLNTMDFWSLAGLGWWHLGIITEYKWRLIWISPLTSQFQDGAWLTLFISQNLFTSLWLLSADPLDTSLGISYRKI